MEPAGVLPSGVELVHRWMFLLDNLPEWIGGGFSVGEFLLRSDGVLLRRSVSSSFWHGQTTWRAGPWSEFHRFPAGTGQGQARHWLVARGYELGDPSPVAVHEAVAGPYPGLPEHFQRSSKPR
jgi:hypothetical protein